MLSAAGESGGAAHTAELFRTNLEAIGLRLDIRPVDFATYVGISTATCRPRSGRTCSRRSGRRITTTPGTTSGRRSRVEAWQSGNGGHYCNERVEAVAGAGADRWRRSARTDPPWARSSRSSPETIRRRSTTPSPNGSPCCAATSAGSRPIWSSAIWSTSMPCIAPSAER